MCSWAQDTFPSLAFVCSTSWRCIFPVDCIADFDCTFVSNVLTGLLGQWSCNTGLSRCYSLIFLVGASIRLWYFSRYGDWFWGTKSHEFCTCTSCIWDTCFEDVSPIMFRLDCCGLSWWLCKVWTLWYNSWIASIGNSNLVHENRWARVQVQNPICLWSIIFNGNEFNRAWAFDCGCFVVTNSTQTVCMAPVTVSVSRAGEMITTWFGIFPDLNFTSLKIVSWLLMQFQTVFYFQKYLKIVTSICLDWWKLIVANIDWTIIIQIGGLSQAGTVIDCCPTFAFSIVIVMFEDSTTPFRF